MDLETECAVSSCPGYGGHEKCEHALKPHTARVTKVAVVGYDFARVFNSVRDYHHWLFEFGSWTSGETYQFVGQNFKFDLLHSGQNPRSWAHDTQVMAHVHTEKIPESWLASYELRRQELIQERGIKYRKAGGLSLKTLAPYFLGVDRFWETADYNNDEYVLKDARYTRDLCIYFTENMTDQEWSFYTKKELPWAKMLYAVEQRGIICDTARLASLRSKLEAEVAELERQIDKLWAPAHAAWHRLHLEELETKYAAMKNRKVAERNKLVALSRVPTKIEYSSPAQMTWLFRDYFGLNIENFEGDDSTGKAVLERLADEGRADVATYLKWRKKQKILTAFIPTYEEWLQHAPSIHPSFNITGTRTGRLSSSNPNFQQTSSELKKLFVPRAGYKFVTYDLSAIEAKLIAWISEDPALCRVILDGHSIHDYTVNVFFGYDTPLNEVKDKHPRERKAVKNCVFALCYGAGPKRIKETMQQAGFSFSLSQCKQMHANFMSAYPGIKQFHRDITDRFENAEVILNAMGRPIRISSDGNAFMTGFNTLVQSGASDLNLEIAMQVNARARAVGIESYLLLLIHDSLTWEVIATRAAELKALVQEVYSKFKLQTMHGTLTVTGEGGVSDVWE
jgi:DNA polymerase I-like protein with 3'-5' exonuclease and polymerase domains